MAKTREYNVGSIEYIDWKIESNNPLDTVVITSATWEMFDMKTNEKVSDGNCTIQNDLVRALINWDTKGQYRVRVEIDVPPQRPVREVIVIVN